MGSGSRLGYIMQEPLSLQGWNTLPRPKKQVNPGDDGADRDERKGNPRFCREEKRHISGVEDAVFGILRIRLENTSEADLDLSQPRSNNRQRT